MTIITDPAGCIHASAADYVAHADHVDRLADWLQRGLKALAPKVPK